MKKMHSKMGYRTVAHHTHAVCIYIMYIYIVGERRTAGMRNALHLDGAT